MEGHSTITTVTETSDIIDTMPRRDHLATPSGRGTPSTCFETPSGDRAPSIRSNAVVRPRFFQARKIRKGEYQRPWLDRKDPKEKWVTIIPSVAFAIGLCVAGSLGYMGSRRVTNHIYCSILSDDFSGGLSSQTWTKMVEVGGFGNGQFEETTNTNENAYIENGMLKIKPTLQDASLIDENTVINLLSQGTCSSSSWSDCVAVTNTTNGTIVNPVKSARLRTTASIKYGRIEVEAKMPSGDWLWPAIWMLPVADTYGLWPASGEIDIAESRGNNYTYTAGGNSIASSKLHFGPDTDNDMYYKATGKRQALHSTYASKFHTYGLEWTEKYLFSYIDNRLYQTMYTKFDKPFWTRGDFPAGDDNGTALENPWSGGTDATPFDQDFYLILNVAVGGTNGWFPDGEDSKPWVDASPIAMREFWDAQDQWYPTWQDDGEMVVKSVKMWQQKGYNGC